MMIKTNLKIKNIIIGMGKTGLSFAKFLDNQKMKFYAIDSRDSPPNYWTFKRFKNLQGIHTNNFESDWLTQKANLFVSPGIVLSEKIKQAIKIGNLKLHSDLEIFLEHYKGKGKTIAITGTNGKSTVVSLITHIFKKANKKVLLIGNIGIPALDYINQIDQYDYVIIEISSYQIDLLPEKIYFDISCILNITADHLERYTSFKDYTEAKKRIYSMSKCVLINSENTNLPPCPSNIKQIEYLNINNHNDWQIINQGLRYYLKDKNQLLISEDEFKLRGGKSNLENIIVAIKTVEYFIDSPIENLIQAIQSFEPLKHRIEFIKKINQVIFINDSKATNPSSVEFCLNSLKTNYQGKINLIMGGDLKNISLNLLFEKVLQTTKAIYVYGKDKLIFKKKFENNIQTFILNNLNEAVKLAYQNSQAGDIVVLSPACSSLDMFTDYTQRGNEFINIVNQLNNV